MKITVRPEPRTHRGASGQSQNVLAQNGLGPPAPRGRKLATPMQRLGQKIIAHKNAGWSQNVQTLQRLLLKKFYYHGSRYLWRAQKDTLTLLPERHAGPKDLRTREITRQDETLLEEFMSEKNMEIVHGRFIRGDRCWGAVQDSQILGFFWMSKTNNRDNDLNVDLKLRPGELYLYDGVIRKSMRGRGLMLYLLNSVLKSKLIADKVKIITLVDTRNTPMLKILNRFSFRKEEMISRWKLFFLQHETRRPISAGGPAPNNG